MRLYSVYLTEGLLGGLKRLKKRDHVSESDSVREALSEFLKRRGIAVNEKKGGTRPRKRK